MWHNHTKLKIYFYVLLLISIYAASYDMYVASLPSLGTYFHQPSNLIQITITIYAAASIIMVIPIGILSDIIGRKKSLLFLIIIVIIGSIICLQPMKNLYWFYFGRALQGIGGSGIYIVAMSIPKDILQKEDFLKVWQWLTLAFFIAPSIATALGSYIVFHFSWQAIFYVIIILCIITFILIASLFRETKPQKSNTIIANNNLSILTKYKAVFSSRKFLAYSYTTALAWAGMGLYYLFLPFIIVNQFHHNIIIFGWVAFSMVMAGVFGRILNMLVLSKKITLEQTAFNFCILNVFSSLLLLLATITPPELSFYLIIISSIIFGFSASISAIAGSSIALSTFDKTLSATATAVYGLMIDCVIAAVLAIGPIFSTSINTLSIIMVTLTISALVFVYFNQKNTNH